MRHLKAAALGLAFCLVLLSGCAPVGLWQYPRPAAEEESGDVELLTLVLPQDADQTLQDAIELLTAKAKDVSGGRLILQVVRQEDPLALYREQIADAVLLTDTQAAQLAPALLAAQLPFLYPAPEALLTALQDPEGPVMDGSFASALGGEVLAVYYGGSVGLAARSNLYLSEVGVEGIGALGNLEGLPGSQIFIHLGVSAVDQQPLIRQLQLFDVRELRAMELPLGSQMLPSEMKYFYPTRHRVRTFWLLLRDGTELSRQGVRHLRQAVSYTIRSQNRAREALEESWVASLADAKVETPAQKLEGIFALAARYMRGAYQEAGIPQRLWDKLLPAMQG